LREEIVVAVSDEEADGFLSIMGYGEAADFEIAEAKSAAGFENIPTNLMLKAGLYRQGGGPVSKDFDLGETRESAQGGGVITVFVGEKNGVDAFEFFTDFLEHPREAFRTETGVNQHARVIGLY